MWESHMYIHEWRASPHPDVMRKYEGARLHAVAVNMPDSVGKEHVNILADELMYGTGNCSAELEVGLITEHNRLAYLNDIETEVSGTRAQAYHQRKRSNIMGLFDISDRPEPEGEREWICQE